MYSLSRKSQVVLMLPRTCMPCPKLDTNSRPTSLSVRDRYSIGYMGGKFVVALVLECRDRGRDSD